MANNPDWRPIYLTKDPNPIMQCKKCGCVFFLSDGHAKCSTKPSFIYSSRAVCLEKDGEIQSVRLEYGYECLKCGWTGKECGEHECAS